MNFYKKSASIKNGKEKYSISINKGMLSLYFKFVTEASTIYIVDNYPSVELSLEELQNIIATLCHKSKNRNNWQKEMFSSQKLAKETLWKLYRELIKKDLENIASLPDLLLDERIEREILEIIDKNINLKIEKEPSHQKLTKTQAKILSQELHKKYNNMLEHKKSKIKEINFEMDGSFSSPLAQE